MSPNRKPGDSAESEEAKAEALARVYKFILSYPIPSREPEEPLPEESPGDSAESPGSPEEENEKD